MQTVLTSSHQEPKRTHKAPKNTNSAKNFSEQFERATRSLPSKTQSRKCAINNFWTKKSAGRLGCGSRGSRQLFMLGFSQVLKCFRDANRPNINNFRGRRPAKHKQIARGQIWQNFPKLLRFMAVFPSLKTRVLRQITLESSPERLAKSLSHSLLVVPLLSPIICLRRFEFQHIFHAPLFLLSSVGGGGTVVLSWLLLFMPSP